jgi:hypothetical protein
MRLLELIVTIQGGGVLWEQRGHGLSKAGDFASLGEQLKHVPPLNFQGGNHR